MEEGDDGVTRRYADALRIGREVHPLLAGTRWCIENAKYRGDTNLEEEFLLLSLQLVDLQTKTQRNQPAFFERPESRADVEHFRQQYMEVSTRYAELKALDSSATCQDQATKEQLAKEEYERETFEIANLIGPHIDVLRRVYKQTTFVDHFGLVERKKWDGEVQRFIIGVVEPAFGKLLTPKLHSYLCTFIDIVVSKPMEDITVESDIGIDTMSPLEFEAHCANLLTLSGWEARLTPATGDQGADIIASRNGTKMVVQCKKYSSPVGNDAVQQVIAAMAFHDAEIAVVISNATFTPAARRLASKTNVKLMHNTEISTFDF